MKLYLDTSALVKLVQRESESAVLRRYLRSHRDDVRLTSALARTELLRAVAAGDTPWLTTEEFLAAIDANLGKALAD